jgi:hypothetical protein
MSRIRIGTAALMVSMLATACGSSNNATGMGGSSGSGVAGTTGAAGATGGAGTSGSAGTTGAGGSYPTDDGGATDGGFTGTLDASAPYATACAATVRNRGTCMTATDVQCANTCGPNRSGYKNCDCFADVWSCPNCEYVPRNYDCYRLPDPLEACPADPADPEGSTLPLVGSACTRAACSPCGSATLLAYRDSAGSPKVGYCVCGNEQKWTCASTTEWPQ